MTIPTEEKSGSEGLELDNTDTSTGEGEGTETPPATESNKTVPESDLLAVKSAHNTTLAELKTSQEAVASERAMRVAAEAKGAKVDGLTTELTATKESLTLAQEQVNAAATQRVEALRVDLIVRGATEEQVKDLDEAQLKLAGAFQPAATTTPLVTAKGLDVLGSGQEDVSTLSARDKMAAGLKEAKS